jgi:hypothetical protein
MAATATREHGLMEPRTDTEKPHTARIYDYYLGGKDNFAADRPTAERAMQSWPGVRTAVRENRAALGRAVWFLVAETAIRQFLDVGTGLPSANNAHEVAQGLVPSCRWCLWTTTPCRGRRRPDTVMRRSRVAGYEPVGSRPDTMNGR